MNMLADFNQLIIPNYSPISARGGRKSTGRLRRKLSRGRKLKTRRHNKTNKSRTRRRYR